MWKLCCASICWIGLCLQESRAQPPVTTQQAAEGWIALFDGESLFGWQATGEANWRVQDGTIRVDAGEPGWLMTTAEFADFELQVEFLAPDATNSGVFVRSALSPTDPTRDCYEVNIAPVDNPYPTGSLVGRVKTPSQNPAAGPTGVVPDEPSVSPVDSWHTLRVTALGSKCTVQVDGTETVTYSDRQPLRRGRVGLQFRTGAVAFRSVRLRPLNLRPLLNGRDLAGWNTDRAAQSAFTVTDASELQVTNGPGQLETDRPFGDFVLQLDCRVSGDGLNSGIFFRCIPGDKLMGYESQIHNLMQDGDPSRPVDCGTGGIYRRVDARRIVARDHEWFTKTIVATGAHVAVWVNGFQVTDWTDQRDANENPRRGLRLAPGTIAIQGHDPTTNLLFRKLQIVELPRM